MCSRNSRRRATLTPRDNRPTRPSGRDSRTRPRNWRVEARDPDSHVGPIASLDGRLFLTSNRTRDFVYQSSRSRSPRGSNRLECNRSRQSAKAVKADAWPGSLCNRTDPQSGVVRGQCPRTAMCVRNVDVHVSCSSHVDAQLAAFFIDPRAK